MTSESDDSSPHDHNLPAASMPIGALMVVNRVLTPTQVIEVLTYQTQHKVRFGEAAVALGLATMDDVFAALAKQFGYSYSGKKSKPRPELVLLNQPNSPQAEAIRSARAHFMMRLSNSPDDWLLEGRSVAITSADVGVGRTFFTANLGIGLAQLGRRVLIIDANLRAPRLHQVFDIPNDVGLSGVLAAKRSNNVILPVDDVDNLYVMPAGAAPPNPLELLESQDFTALLSELCKRFDHVLLDTPAHMVGADVLATCARTHAALVLVRRNRTTARHALHLIELLQNTGTLLLGTIVNDF